ncbi:hypothetical protein QTP88_001834 [Uroleucon formosanum]
MCRDRLIVGPLDVGLQELLLREFKLTLEKAAEFCRTIEASRQQANAIQGQSSQTRTNAVERVDAVKTKEGTKTHFKWKKNGQSKISSDSNKSWFKDVIVSFKDIQLNVNFKLDSGAEANILPLHTAKLLKLKSLDKTKTVLISLGNQRIKLEGEVVLDCTIKNKRLDACRLLKSIGRIDTVTLTNLEGKVNNKEQIVESYSDIFEGLDTNNLNKAIRKEHHPIPNVEEILTGLEGKNFFSVLDLKDGFWHVKLDEDSSKTDNVSILLPQIDTPEPSCSHSPTYLQTNENYILNLDAEQIVEGNDIGYCFGKNVCDEIKFKLLTDHWSPDENYKFSITTYLQKNLKFQLGWIKRFPWVVYSRIGEQGAVCKYCAIFGREFGGKGSHQKLNILVVKPFNNWKKAIEKFNEHKIALRGTSDYGPLSLDNSEPTYNDGNFLALLRMRISCEDKNLTYHIENQALNASYISPMIQNNFINICGKIIQDQLVNKINQAKCFSVLVDETTDVSRVEQLSLCVRYLDNNLNIEKNEINNYVLKENFLQFVPVNSTTGQNLATVILVTLKILSVIREVHPAALYVHCSAHSLNLALAHSSNIYHIRNCIGTIKSVENFIKISVKRTELLKNKIKEFLPQTKWTKLTSMCETRWVENHDGMLGFSEIYKPIVATLEELQLFVDIETSSKALQLYKCVTTSEFIISMITATTLFSITLPLCKILQSVKCDLSEAVDHVETVLSKVKDMRTNINENFKKIFNKSEQYLHL